MDLPGPIPPDGPRRVRRLSLAALTVLVCLTAKAATKLDLGELQTRTPPAYTPAHAGEKVLVRGVVSAPAFHFPGYRLLAFEDGRHGAALHVLASDHRLDVYHPGDEIEAEGAVSSVAGMVVVVPERIAVVRKRQPPAALPLAVPDLLGFRYLGRLVSTSGTVVEFDDTTGGPYLLITTPGGAYRIFLPRGLNEATAGFTGLTAGDVVQVTGVALQYCPRPPYNTRFELLINSTASVVRTGRGWVISPLALALAITASVAIGVFLWSRERRLHNQRERLRATFQLGEEILGASSAEAILTRIGETLPGVLRVTRVQLYVHNRAAKTLDAVGGENGEPASFSLSAPPDGAPAGAVACFHYRTLLAVPDIARSPFPIARKDGGAVPRSLLFAPMLAQGEVAGVLELDQDNRARVFTADEQALAQHLANQIGVALRLLDQRSVQEQLFRTEKLAAVGRLISGIVNELQIPLSSISDLAARAAEKDHAGPAGRDLAAIAAEARKASGMVARLISFAAAERVEARPVAVGELMRNLIEFREGDWKASGIRLRELTLDETACVLGSYGQLEQVFLNLLVHAEQSLAEAPQKLITIRSSVLARRVLVEIGFTAPPLLGKPEETAGVLGVTRSVIAGHGGEVRLIEKAGAAPHFEVELPLLPRERTAGAAAGNGSGTEPLRRQMTALVIEPDEGAQHQLLALLAASGCRVVPVDNSDSAMELAQRMRFEVAFCSLHAPGLNWVELSERMQSRVGAFVLLSDGYNAELSADFEGEGRFVLPKPVQEADLARALRAAEQIANGRGAA
jgi:GAF domain-containing protein/CheY-like chemotaxis protein